MAYFVAKILKKRPQEILTTWTSCELCVAFGVYCNEKTIEAYENWMSSERTGKAPDKYGVTFIREYTRND